MQNLRREPHSSVTVRRFRKLKSSCYIIAIPSGWHPAPTLTVMQGFEAKKRERRTLPSQFLQIASHIHYPSANRTRVQRAGG